VISQGTLDDRFLNWLYRQVVSSKNRNPEQAHWELAVQLYQKAFLWFIPNDDNRIADGLELRYEFLEKYKVQDVDPLWLDLDVSMLEMLIALSRRVAFEVDGPSDAWFWKLIDNIELKNYTDDIYNESVAEEVNEALDRVIERTYGRDGVGGLFPLRNSRTDQRRVEIRYQMSAYLQEGHYVDDGRALPLRR